MDIIVANNRLAEIRASKSLTQIQVEEATDINQSDLSKYENCSCRISVERAKRLADYYEVSLDEIFMRDTPYRHELAIRDKNRLRLVVEVENTNEIEELYRLLIEHNYVASISRRGSTSN